MRKSKLRGVFCANNAVIILILIIVIIVVMTIMRRVRINRSIYINITFKCDEHASENNKFLSKSIFITRRFLLNG